MGKNKMKNNNNIHVLKNQDIFVTIEDILRSNNSYNIVVPHVCNNINAFGAGFASAISQNYPVVKANFHMLGNQAKLGYTQFITTRENNKNKSKIVIANMIAQNGLIDRIKNPRPLNYASLMSCMINIKNFVTKLNLESEIKTQIHAPKFGSGLAGGNWNFIENLIEDIWGNIPVFIYQKIDNKKLVNS
jgi:hypothetical protein